MADARIDRDWQNRYLSGDTPWDSGLPSRELQRVLVERKLTPGRALELGCGTGTNAVFLARQGFHVTAVDCAPLALERARSRAAAAGVTIDWHEADVQDFGAGLAPFDFIFDRGCYHCCRRVDLAGYLATLQNVTRQGSVYLSLTGNANEQTEQGPPRVTDVEIRTELGGLFEIEQLRAFRFLDPGGVDGPLGWSCLMVRRGEDQS
jgi:SAM-dependent methyltransferase